MSEEKAEYTLKAKHVQELIADAYKEGQEEYRNSVSVELLELPENIRVQALRIQLLAEDIEKLRLCIENGKNQALELVLCATEDGKPKYSNDKARNLAVQQLLRDDELYLSSIDELSRKESELRREQIQIDYLENMFYAYRNIAGMRGVR